MVASVPNCPHQLCLCDWDDGSSRFACRCHEAFVTVDGKVIGGPPPRPLGRCETQQAGPDEIAIGWVDRT